MRNANAAAPNPRRTFQNLRRAFCAAAHVGRQVPRVAVMTGIRRTDVPTNSLLGSYVGSGAYVDCYGVDVSTSVTLACFVEAFYTTPLFKVERLLLGLFISRPSTDVEAKQLAHAQRKSFAAWQVESRTLSELLVRAGRTRSWLMVAPSVLSASGTRLCFGSVVVPRAQAGGGLGAGFGALLGFHKLYSRALLRAAANRLSKPPR